MPKQIFWTQELTIVLLEVIHMKGAHTPGYGKTEEVWDSVNEAFFMQPEAAHLKADCYVPGSSRKFRDYWEKKRREVNKAAGWADYCATNKSAIIQPGPDKVSYSNNFTISSYIRVQVFELVRTLEMEIDRKQDLASKKGEEDAAAKRFRLDEIALNTLNPERPRVKRQKLKDPLTGAISVSDCSSTDSSAKAAALKDDHMWSFFTNFNTTPVSSQLTATASPETTAHLHSNEIIPDERQTGVFMMEWLKHHEYALADCVKRDHRAESLIKYQDEIWEVINSIGINILIIIYCENGFLWSMAHFIEVLKEEDIKPMMARRVFSVLEQVRLFTMGDMNYEAEYPQY